MEKGLYRKCSISPSYFIIVILKSMNNHYKDIISEKYKKILFIHGWGFTRQILKDNFDTAYLGQALFIALYEHMIDTNGDLKTAAKNILRENEDIDLIISWSLGCFLAKEIEYIIQNDNMIQYQSFPELTTVSIFTKQPFKIFKSFNIIIKFLLFFKSRVVIVLLCKQQPIIFGYFFEHKKSILI